MHTVAFKIKFNLLCFLFKNLRGQTDSPKRIPAKTPAKSYATNRTIERVCSFEVKFLI